MLAARITQKLTKQFAPVHLQVLNESNSHSVPKGSETHFKVVIVSAVFANESLLARHRQVNDALAEELHSGVHALSIVAKTPEQWATSSSVPASPVCLGGSKAG